jgi:signal transduction histidine kinase
MFRFLRPYQLAVDCVVAVVFFWVTTSLSSGSDAYLLSGALSVAVVLRRLSPGVALAVAWAGALSQMYLASMSPQIADFGILAVVYSTAAYGGKVIKWLGLVSVGVGAFLGSVFLTFRGAAYQFGLNLDSTNVSGIAGTVLQLAYLLIAMLVLLGLPWTLGLLVRTRIAARGSREAELAAQREAEVAEQDVIVEQERNRIARDMHDVVAHSLAVVVAQADGARYARASDPDAVDGALTAISSTAREALADVRLLLGQLRHSQAEGPQPALDDLDRLLGQLRASGLVISHTVTGTPLGLGMGQQIAVYRIVQEALTNVLRHGDTTTEVQVNFTWAPHDLEVTIISTLASSPATGELRLGHGLAGMRERAALAGGRLTAEPRDRRFVVTAFLPAAHTGVRA